MARIAGIDIPKNKRGVIALTYIFGIGRSRAQESFSRSKGRRKHQSSRLDDDQIAELENKLDLYN